MGHVLRFEALRDWVTEGSQWRPPAMVPPSQVILRDEAGTPIGLSIMESMRLTLYDPSLPGQPIIAGVEQVDIKNTRGCSLSGAGVFILTLLGSDTVIVNPTKPYEKRLAQVAYTTTSGKSDVLQVYCIVRNIHRYPSVAP